MGGTVVVEGLFSVLVGGVFFVEGTFVVFVEGMSSVEGAFSGTLLGPEASFVGPRVSAGGSLDASLCLCPRPGAHSCWNQSTCRCFSLGSNSFGNGFVTTTPPSPLPTMMLAWHFAAAIHSTGPSDLAMYDAAWNALRFNMRVKS